MGQQNSDQIPAELFIAPANADEVRDTIIRNIRDCALKMYNEGDLLNTIERHRTQGLSYLTMAGIHPDRISKLVFKFYCDQYCFRDEEIRQWREYFDVPLPSGKIRQSGISGYFHDERHLPLHFTFTERGPTPAARSAFNDWCVGTMTYPTIGGDYDGNSMNRRERRGGKADWKQSQAGRRNKKKHVAPSKLLISMTKQVGDKHEEAGSGMDVVSS